MTERREFYAASVEDAVEKASSALDIPIGDLSYRVVDEGNSGFLGIGARDARIEVDAPATEVTDTAPREVVPTEEDEENEAELAPTERPETPVETEAGEPEGSDGGSAPAMFLEEPDGEADEIDGETLNVVRERIEALLDAMGFDARVDVYDAGGFVAVDVAPDNTALFIGQKGETIDALQYLLNASVNRRTASRTRIVIDAEGYRQRRVEAIQGMAHRTARRALREGRTVELPPMNPAERRVVHLFLQDNPRVTTDSQGTGDARRVLVSPS